MKPEQLINSASFFEFAVDEKQICAPRHKGPLLVNILIVENNTVNKNAIGITPFQAGYHDVHNKTIEQALNKLNHNHVDAVLLDINLPDGDGSARSG